MIRISSALAAARRFSPGLPVLGLALAAGLSWTPAAAANDLTGWRASCQFKSIPQSGGEGLRYDACQRMLGCQRLADAAGRTIFEAGCFGVSPEAPALPAASRPTR